MHAEIVDWKDQIASICRRHRALRLEVFGLAAWGTDFDPERSDVDFLVKLESLTLLGLFWRRMGLVRGLRQERHFCSQSGPVCHNETSSAIALHASCGRLAQHSGSLIVQSESAGNIDVLNYSDCTNHTVWPRSNR